jgi:hypothetical protein
MSQDCVFAGLPSQAATLNSDNTHLRLVLFQPIREPIPEFSPWTSAEQVTMGHILHAPNKCQSVEKHPALCLPQCEACKEWLKWATARENLPVGAGFVMTPESDYNLAASRSSNPHSAQDQQNSVLKTGKRIVFWQRISMVNEPTEGHEK